MHLVLGGVVSFAESIDTVALNIREIAPTFSSAFPASTRSCSRVSCPLGESGAAPALRELHGLGRRLSTAGTPGGAPANLRDRLGYALLCLLFRNIQRHLGFAPARNGFCAGASISPETLRFFDISAARCRRATA